jgi:hypothetical protein
MSDIEAYLRDSPYERFEIRIVLSIENNVASKTLAILLTVLLSYIRIAQLFFSSNRGTIQPLFSAVPYLVCRERYNKTMMLDVCGD